MDNSSANVIIVAIIGLLSSCISAFIGAFATITAARLSVNRQIHASNPSQFETIKESKKDSHQVSPQNLKELNNPNQTKVKLSGWITVASIIFVLCFSCYCVVSLWLWNYGDAYLKQFMTN